MKTLITLLVLLFASFAAAHVQPDHAEPKIGSTVDASPTEVKIWFDGPVGVAKSKLEVTDADGKSITSGPLHGDVKDNTVLIIPITNAHGKVMVLWEAYCPDCDHTTHGTFTFSVRN